MVGLSWVKHTLLLLSVRIAYVSAAEECQWAEYKDEQIWIDYMMAAFISLMGFFFNYLNQKVFNYLSGGSDLHQTGSSHLSVLHGAFTSQITILGFVSWAAFFLYQTGAFYLVTGSELDGKRGPYTGTSFFLEFVFVGATLFLSQLLYFAFCAEVIYLLKRKYLQLEAYSTDKANPKYKDLAQMDKYFTTWITQYKEANNITREHLNFEAYMTAKFNISVPRLVHFKGSSWAVTAVMFLLISLYANAYFWGDSYEHILSYVEVVCMLICTLSFFRAVVMFKRNYSVEAEPKLFPVQEWRMENIIVRALQAFAIIFPFHISNYFIFVLSLPPYLDRRDLGIIIGRDLAKCSSIDVSATNHNELFGGQSIMISDSTVKALRIQAEAEMKMMESLDIKQNVRNKSGNGNKSKIKNIKTKRLNKYKKKPGKQWPPEKVCET